MTTNTTRTVIGDSTVYVCPERDIECGNRPANWCSKCPQRIATGAAGTDKGQDHMNQDACNAALRAAPAGQHIFGQPETLDEKALNTLLWFYRRMVNSYGRLPFAEEAITGLRARIAASRFRAEGGNTKRSSVPSPATGGELPKCWSCKRAYTAEQRANADGNCPHCGVEIELAAGAELDVEAERRACAEICDRLEAMMVQGGGELRPGERLAQAARLIRERAATCTPAKRAPMTCQKCGANRLVEPCRAMQGCPMFATAGFSPSNSPIGAKEQDK